MARQNIDDTDAAQSIKIIGSEADGTEQTPVSSNDDGELKAIDVTRNPGTDKVLALDTITPQLLKVGATAKADRKYITMEALSTNIKWGFSNTTQSFDLFKSQFFLLPFGVETEIWFIMESGTGSVAIGEI